jgi:hypothetical protein
LPKVHLFWNGESILDVLVGNINIESKGSRRDT